MRKMISTVKGLVLISFLMVLTGVMSTNAQTVSTVASGFGQAAGVAFDSSGNMYVSARNQNKIMKVTPAGVVSTFAGSGTAGSADGPAATATFKSPGSLTVDSGGNVYVIDAGNLMIRKITTSGVVSKVKDFLAWKVAPTAILADPSGNLFYFITTELHKIDSAGTDTVVAGRGSCNATVNGTGTAACFSSPMNLARDSGGNLYTVENSPGYPTQTVVRKISPGYAVTELGARGTMGQPLSIAADASGNVFVGSGIVTNPKNNYQMAYIYKVSSVGDISTYAGWIAGWTDGGNQSASFNYPGGGLAFSGGTLFVADYNNGAIRKIK